MSRSVYYWKGEGTRRNFGDSLAQILLDELFAPLPVKGRGVFIIGSCIDDLFFNEPSPGAPPGLDDRLVFWGCGMRTPSGLSQTNRGRCEILAVRGPLSRSALRLGDSVPLGDSALLLPALYQPRTTPGGSVCVPHFHDARSDEELLKQSGCDRILRPNLPESRRSMEEFIDQIASADFVLAAALHGAIVAAAYGRPFAYWDNGHLDLPFKWADFAASVNIPGAFAASLDQGRALYAKTIARAIRLPPLGPLVASAPLLLRPDGLLKVCEYELRRQGLDSGELRGLIAGLIERQKIVGEISGRDAAGKEGNWGAHAIAEMVTQFEDSVAHANRLDKLGVDQRAQLQEQAVKLSAQEADLERTRRELAAASTRADSLEQRAGALAAESQRKEAELETLAEAGRTLTSRLNELQVRTNHLQARYDQVTGEGRRKRRWMVKLPFLNASVPARPGMLLALAQLRSRDALLVAGSPLFDERWYRRQYPDVAAKGMHPLVHYLRHGAREGRDPSPAFDTDYYLGRYPDVASSTENPLAHYLRHGSREGRFPNPQFDPRWYLTRYPDVKAAGLEPLTHYVQFGAAEGRQPYFDARPGHAARLETASAQAPVALVPSQAARAALPAHVVNRDGPRMLIVDSVYPRPDRDSGSVTARYLVEIFLQLGWQVSFFADAELGDPNGYGKQLEQIGVRCLRQPPALDAFLQAEGASLSLVMLFRVYSGGRHYEAVRRHCPDAKVVFETVDLHFLREERQAQLHRDAKAMNIARATRERELHLARSADLAIVVSEFERELLDREVPGVRAMTLPLILETPGRKAPFSARHGVAFIGGYLHTPNIDAVHYFLDAIWPEVLRRLPTCTFHIVGADLPEELRARAGKNVAPVGYVKDLDGFLEKIRLTVAPLRYGAGVKGKVGSSLAAGVPCVGSSIAAEGMGLETGQAIAVADDPVQFAERIVALHEDAALWERMSDAGFRYVSGQFSLEAARGRMVAMLERLGLPAAPGAKAEAG